MAGDTKDVELRIRALLEGKKTFQETVDGLKAITAAQEGQITAAKKSASGAKELENAFRSLGDIAKDLTTKSGLLENFQREAAALELVKKKVDDARDAHAAYNRSLSDGATKEQTAQLAKLAKDVERADRALNSYQSRIDGTKAKLEAQGLSATNAAAAQREIADALERTLGSLERYNAALKTVGADAAAYQQQSDAARKLEQAESDRLATIQRIGEAQLRQRGAVAMEEELASMRDAEVLSRRLARAREEEQAAELQNLRALQDAERARDALRLQITKLEGTAATQRSIAQNDELSRLKSMLEVETARAAVLANNTRAFNDAANKRRAAEQGARDAAEAAQKQAAADRDTTRTAAARSTSEANAARVRAIADADGKRRADERAAADAAEAKRKAEILAFEKAIADQREKAIAAQRQEIENQKALRNALRDAADAAVADGKGYATLGRAKPTEAAPDLAGTIRGITDPASQAMKSLQGVEAAVARVEQRARQAFGPVKGFKDAMSDMSAAQRSIETLARSVDAYEKQIAALRRTRAEYVAARSDIAALADQMRRGVGGDEIARAMSEAQARMKGAATAMRDQTVKARELRDGLRTAGVATNDIASTQANLQAQAQRSVSAANQLTAAVKLWGAAADETDKKAKAWKLFHTEGGRTTLSYMQRLRGELLAYTTAWVGLQAAVSLARGVIDTTLQNAKIQNRLSVVFEGDAKRAQGEFKYLKQLANEIGVNFQTAALGYSKFAIAAKTANFTQAETRRVFEQVSIAAKNAGLSNEEYEGTLKAIEQMMSKGVIQAEELKGQLGDRLPGAVSLLAQSMGKTTGELLKMMEQGGVTARYVINLADTMGSTFGKVEGTAATRLQEAINRQENAANDFKQALGESGFIDAYTEFLKKLATMMQGEDGRHLAQTMSALFSAIVNGASWAAQNIDLLKVALAAIAGLKVFGILRSWTKDVRLLAGAMKLVWGNAKTLFTGLRAAASAGGPIAVMTGGITTLAGALKLLGRSIPILGAALTAYEIGTLLINRQKNGVTTPIGGGSGPVATGNASVNAIPGSAYTPGAPGSVLTPSTGTGVNPDDAQLDSIKKALATGQKKLDTKDKASRMGAAKQQLEERIAIASEEVSLLRKAAEENIKDEKKRAEAITAIDKQLSQIRTVETRRFNNEQTKSGESAAAKRIRLATDIANSLDNLANKTADKEAQLDPNATFAQRLAAREKLAADTYDKVEEKLKQLDALAAGDKGVANAVNKVLKEKGVANLDVAKEEVAKGRTGAVKATGDKTKQEEVDRLDKKLSDNQDALNRKLEVEEALYKSGVQTREQMRANQAQLNADYAVTIGESADALRDFAAQYTELLDPNAYEALIARLRVLKAGLLPEKTTGAAAIADQEALVNRVIEQRSVRLSELDSQYKAGEISGRAAADGTTAAYAKFKPVVDNNINALVQMAQAQRARNDLTEEEKLQLDALILKYQNLQRELGLITEGFTPLKQAAIDATASGIQNGLNGATDAIGKMVTGQMSLANGFKSIGQSAAETFAQILRDIAVVILKMEIANALANSGGGTGYLSAIGVKLGGVKAAAPAAGIAGAAAAPAAGIAGAAAAPAAGIAGAAAAPAAGIAGAAAAPAAGEAVTSALSAGATEAAAIQTAAAASAATTTTGAAVVAATTTEGGAIAAEVIDKGSSLTAAITDQSSATTAAGIITGAAQIFASTVVTAAQTEATIDAATLHSGGVIGAGSGQHNSRVQASWFSGAPRFHSGGIPGLARDEVPAVLQKGEEVLTRNDPRHILNGGKGGGQSGSAQMAGRFVLVDDRSKVAEAMSSAEGEAVTMVHIKRNLPSIRKLIKG